MDGSIAAPKVTTVDADGHVLEPRDLWERHLEPGLRDRIARLPEESQRKVLGTNVLRFYGLGA